MNFLRLTGQAINFQYLIRTEDRDGPDRPIRVVMVPGEALDFVGTDAARIRARLVDLDPDPPAPGSEAGPPPADDAGKNITGEVTIRRNRPGSPGSSGGGDAEPRGA